LKYEPCGRSDNEKPSLGRAGWLAVFMAEIRNNPEGLCDNPNWKHRGALRLAMR